MALPNASEAVDFYVKAFNAEKRWNLPLPGGKIAHGEFRIGDTVIMYSDAAVAPFAKDPLYLKGFFFF